jgi:protein transport protein SEC31
LSVDWCQHDHDLLLSCGKDNRTILWNPQVPKLLGEFPIASTWVFETRWCPQNPDILANASFEGKITVHRLQSTLPKSEINGTQAGGKDFFEERQYVSEGGFELKQAPKWLQVPCAAAFGFGGNLITVKNSKGKGEVKINKYISEPKISENASAFEDVIQMADWIGFCEKQIEKTSDGERSNWELLKLLFDNEPRKRLIEYLGIKETNVDTLSEEVLAIKLGRTDSETTAADDTQMLAEFAPKNNRLSGIFTSQEKADDPFSQLSPSPETRLYYQDPFSITSTSDNESDKLITQAILFGRFDQAVDICLNEDRIADAFVLATQGGAALQKRVQDAYFSQNIQRSGYLRLLQDVIESNLWDVAEHAELADWKYTLVVFCTFAKADDEFSNLCEALGQRLGREGKIADAKVCYLAGKKLNRIVDIWIADAETQEKEELENGTSASAFSIHATALQGFVEKVTVFKHTKDTTDGDLKQIYDKYTEFVEIVASQGNLSVAQKYIDLLPGENEAIKTVKNRLAKATAIVAAPVKAAPQVASPARRQPLGMGPTFPASQDTPALPSGYVPPQSNVFPSQQYHPALAPAASPSTTVNASIYNPPTVGSQYQSPYIPYNQGLQPTNPAISRISDLPPPPPKKTTENWNDPPMLPNPVRTRTPVAPFPKPPSPYIGPTPTPSSALTKQPVGPPPPSAKPPQRVTSPPIPSPQMAGGAFAPPRQATTPQMPSQPPPHGLPAGRPSANTFMQSLPMGTPQLPPQGQYMPPSSPVQTRLQYAPPPVQQQNNFAPPPQGPTASQFAPPPPARGQYTPAVSPPPETPSAPPAKATLPPIKYRISLSDCVT